MVNLLNRAVGFFAGFFQENKPESFSRGITFVVVMFVLGWDTSYVYHTKQLIDVATMAGQVLFMTAFYFGGKGISAYTSTRTNTPDVPVEPAEKPKTT